MHKMITVLKWVKLLIYSSILDDFKYQDNFFFLKSEMYYFCILFIMQRQSSSSVAVT